MYAQQLIQIGLNQVSAYEPVAGQAIKTLEYSNESTGLELNNGGLLAGDLVKRINTEGKWFYQKYQFTSWSVSVECDKDTNLSDCTNKFDFLTLTCDCEVKANTAIAAFEETRAGTYLSSTVANKAFADQTKFTKVTDDDGNQLGYSGVLFGPKMEISGEGSLTAWTTVEEDKWHALDGDDSVPTTLALDAGNYFSTIQPASDGEGFDPEHLKDIGVVVYKTWLDPSEGNKVSYEPVEAYCGSLYKDAKDPNTGVSKFIDTIINS